MLAEVRVRVALRALVAVQHSRWMEGRTMITKKFAMLALTIGAFVPVGLTTASSQGYPSRPITLIVPYSPGGPTEFSCAHPYRSHEVVAGPIHRD